MRCICNEVFFDVLEYVPCLTFRNSIHTQCMLDSEDGGVVLWKVDGCFVSMDEYVNRG
jgi:hypothetical protein